MLGQQKTAADSASSSGKTPRKSRSKMVAASVRTTTAMTASMSTPRRTIPSSSTGCTPLAAALRLSDDEPRRSIDDGSRTGDDAGDLDDFVDGSLDALSVKRTASASGKLKRVPTGRISALSTSALSRSNSMSSTMSTVSTLSARSNESTSASTKNEAASIKNDAAYDAASIKNDAASISTSDKSTVADKKKQKAAGATATAATKKALADKPTVTPRRSLSTIFAASPSPLRTLTLAPPLIPQVVHEELILSSSSSSHASSALVLRLLDDMHRTRRCVVVTGAGISVSGGIPDFRSFDGLYNLVKSRYPDAVVKGRDLFDAHLFRDPVSTSVFYTFMGELKAMVERASITSVHTFIKRLHDSKKLLRCYTQNIDCMEERVGLRCDAHHSPTTSPVVLLHGSLQSVVCTLCKARWPYGEEHRLVFSEGRAPACVECQEKNDVRVAMNRRAIAVGTLRPDIILYNEHHAAGDAIAECVTMDVRKRPEVLLVMGTSLKVSGIKKLVKDMAKEVKLNGGLVVLINKTPLQSMAEWKQVFDFTWLGSADDIVEYIERGLVSRERAAALKREKKAAADRKDKENTGMATSNASQPVITAAMPRVVAKPRMAASKGKSTAPPATLDIATENNRSAASSPQLSPKKHKVSARTSRPVALK